jgi:hypothetical protein
MSALADLSEAQRALIIELVERERRELPAELHHTRTTAVRQQLRERAKLIDGLLARIRQPAPA